MTHLAAQLTQRWNQSAWGPAAKLLADPPQDGPAQPAPPRKPRQFQRRLTPEVMDQAVADYVSGMSSKAVGAKYGISANTVIHTLRVRGIKPRPRRERFLVGPKLEEAIQLRIQGWNYTQIAKHFGISDVAAANALKQAGQA